MAFQVLYVCAGWPGRQDAAEHSAAHLCSKTCQQQPGTLLLKKHKSTQCTSGLLRPGPKPLRQAI